MPVTVTITNNDGATICTETQNVITNEVGIAALEIGNAKTFDNVDWTKLPLWLSANVGDIIIAKSQILNVPVAEYAKNTGFLTLDILSGQTWKNEDDTRRFSFDRSGRGTFSKIEYNEKGENWVNYSLCYEFSGDVIGVSTTHNNYKSFIFFYDVEHKCLFSSNGYHVLY